MHEFSTPQDTTSISAVTSATHTGKSTPISNAILCPAYTAKYPSHTLNYVVSEQQMHKMMSTLMKFVILKAG